MVRKGKKENLKPFNELTVEEHREIASKGGKKSAEVRKEKRMLKDTLKMLMDTKPTPDMVKMYSKVFGIDPKDLQDVISGGLIRKAMQGDSKAFEVIRDTMGEKPIERTQGIVGNLEITDKGVVNEVFKKLKEMD